MISVDEREEIRRYHLIEGESLRKIEREHGYSRRTIHKALGDAEGREERQKGERKRRCGAIQSQDRRVVGRE